MAGFDKPVDETNRPRDEGVLVSRIEADKKGKEAFADLPMPVKNILSAAMIIYLKSLFDSYRLQSHPEETDFLKTLISFKNLLQLLGSKDQSKHPHFTQQLSEVWHKIRQDFNFIKFLGRDPPEIILKIKYVFTEITQYPSNQEHTFGYYLEEHVGEE